MVKTITGCLYVYQRIPPSIRGTVERDRSLVCMVSMINWVHGDRAFDDKLRAAFLLSRRAAMVTLVTLISDDNDDADFDHFDIDRRVGADAATLVTFRRLLHRLSTTRPTTSLTTPPGRHRWRMTLLSGNFVSTGKISFRSDGITPDYNR